MDKLTPHMEAAILRLVGKAIAAHHEKSPVLGFFLQNEAARREGEAKPVGSTCNQERMAAGLPYPRTCTKCGLGKCVSGLDSAATPPAADAPDELVQWLRQQPDDMNEARVSRRCNEAADRIEADALTLKYHVELNQIRLGEVAALRKRVAELEAALQEITTTVDLGRMAFTRQQGFDAAMRFSELLTTIRKQARTVLEGADNG